MIRGYVDIRSPVSKHSLNDKLECWWLALPNSQGSLRLTDLVIGRPANIGDGTSWGPGLNDYGAIVLDGTTNPASTSQPVMTNGFSWEVCARMDRSGFDPSLVGAGANWGLLCAIDSRQFYIKAPSPNVVSTASAASAVQLRKWFHLVGTVSKDSGGNAIGTVYLDGLKVNVSPSGTYVNTPGVFYIGGNNSDNPWAGAIQSVRVYSRTLSDRDVAVAYNQTLRGYLDLLNLFTRRKYGIPGVAPGDGGFNAGRVRHGQILTCGVI